MGKSRKLVYKKILIEQLTAHLKNQMWDLFSKNYDSVSRNQFDIDLSDKTAVFVFFDSGDHTFQGFSTYKIYLHDYKNQKIGVIFSGDTMIHPDYWGQGAMHGALGKEAILWKLKHPTTPLYWYMICMGYRTYLSMARCLPTHFWPRYSQETPDWEKGLIASLSSERFKEAWKENEGLIRYDQCLGTLKKEVAPITEKELKLEDIKYFVKVNPGYTEGDELACIARISFIWFLGFIPVIFMKKLKKLSVKKPVQKIKTT